jgi:uncharacterized protein
MKPNRIGIAIRTLLLPFLFFSYNVHAQDEDSLLLDSTLADSIADTEIEPTSPFAAYFTPLSSKEVALVKSGWNTSAVIADYKFVPNPRALNGSLVSDPHRILSNDGRDTLNRIMKMVEDSTTAQMVVVCLNSIGDNDPHMYATDLFNHWGVGSAETNNGLLIMVVLDIRKASIITGRGMESYITDLETAEVRDNEMIPFFKQEDYTTGVIRGVQVFAEMIFGVPPEYLKAANQNYDATNNNETIYIDDFEVPSTPFYKRPVFSLYMKITVVLSVIWLMLLLYSLFIKDLHKRYHIFKIFTLLIFPVLFPIPFVGLFFLSKKLMKKWRNTERFSPDTGEFMIKLSESEDDEFLKQGQVTEELIKSIDYDVWVTQDRSEFQVLAYKQWFSKFRKCPKCKFQTWQKEYDKVISSATYTSSGTGQRKYSCKSCGHSKTTNYRIPRKTASNTSSGGGYSSGGSSYGGSSGGSSYGGGGGGSSFGGGSSGGGGSTGGW